MKRLWWVAVLVTIAFAICFTEIYAIKNSRDTFTKLIKKWDKQEKKLNYLMEHSLLDEISMDIEQLPEYTNEDGKEDYLSANDRIKKQFNVLYTNELPYGDNIF